jgi:hypothetical protein
MFLTAAAVAALTALFAGGVGELGAAAVYSVMAFLRFRWRHPAFEITLVGLYCQPMEVVLALVADAVNRTQEGKLNILGRSATCMP